MSRKKSTVNTIYFPVGTICLAPELVKRLKHQAELSGGVAAVVRACLSAILYPESLENQPLRVPSRPEGLAPEASVEPEEPQPQPFATAEDF